MKDSMARNGVGQRRNTILKAGHGVISAIIIYSSFTPQ
jgi:hypothetical protein